MTEDTAVCTFRLALPQALPFHEFKMAGGLDVMMVDYNLYPPAASLQNCLKFSHSYEYLGILCDFGFTTILKVNDKPPRFEGVVCKTLKHDNETLEGQAWSSDDQVYAVLSQKAYLYMVEKDFSLLHVIELYYVPKDIAIATESKDIQRNPGNTSQYKAAIAGPNGVEMYHLELTENASINVKEGIHLHNDLAIVLVEFSPDLQCLAVAALDCHFGIWIVKSLEGEQRDFWYKHLATVRITSISFSGDSQNIAVSCWDGCCYVFTKVSYS
ncbi:hypothetical protein QZH41_008317 [Actinostola sp. cb2023]|nr:hypothetical protein QZH41_008317 [Actinostola sp. cb2023]